MADRAPGKGSRETISETLKGLVKAIIDGLKESKIYLLKTRGSTDTCNNVKKKVPIEFSDLAEVISQQGTDSATWILIAAYDRI